MSHQGIFRIEGNRLTVHRTRLGSDERPVDFDWRPRKTQRYEYVREMFWDEMAPDAQPEAVPIPAEPTELDLLDGPGPDGPDGPGDPDEPPASDPERDEINGRWVVAGVFPRDLAKDGGDMRFARGMVIDIAGGRMAPPGIEWGDIEYRLRPDTDPKQIDVTYRNDSMWGSNYYDELPNIDENGVEVIEHVSRAGIYEFVNPEMLKLHLAGPGNQRPTGTMTERSPGYRSLTLSRLPSEPTPPVAVDPDLLDASKSPLLGSWRCVGTEGLVGFENADLTMEIRPTDSPLFRPHYRDAISLQVTSRISIGSAPIATRTGRAFVAPGTDPIRVDFDASSEDPEGEIPPLGTRGILRIDDDMLIMHLDGKASMTRPPGFDRSDDSSSILLVYRKFDPDEPPANDPELDEILSRWEQASGKIETLYAGFEQIDEKRTFGETKRYKGAAYLRRPNLALLQLDRRTGDKDDEKLVFDRRLLFNGDEFVEFDGATRQITVLPLAGDAQGRAPEGGVLPFRFRLEDFNRLLPRPQPPILLDFLFGMNAEDFKRRYRLSLHPPIQDDTVRISIRPKDDTDRNTFSVAVLILDATTLRPRSIHLLAPNGQDKQTYLIKQLKANGAIEPGLFSWNPAMAQKAQNDGWRVVSRPEPEPIPDPLAGLIPLPTQAIEVPSRDDPAPRDEDDPRKIDHRLSTLEAKLDRLLELLDAPDR